MNARQDPAALVGRLRATVRSHATRPLAWRVEQLTRLRTLLDQNRDALAEAVYADLHRLPAETFRSEVDACIREIDHVLEHLERWLAPAPVTVPADAGLPAGSTGAVRYNFEPDVMAVVQGAVPETTALLAERFDHVFFTGSGGDSGTGSYHGQHSLETFSHRKAVLDVPLA